MEQTYSFTVKNFESAEIATESKIMIDETSNKPYTELLPTTSNGKPQYKKDVFDEIGCELGEVIINMTEYWKNRRFLDMKSTSVISSDIIKLCLKNIKIIETPLEFEDEDKKDIEFDEDF